jgi:outer membrane protein assembly factor BamA
MRITSLTFVGQPALSPDQQEQIAKSVTPLPYVDRQKDLNELLGRLRGAWQHLGYFKVKVELGGIRTLSENAETKMVAIAAKVEAGSQYRLGEIQFTALPDGASFPRPESGPQRWQFTPAEMRAFFPLQRGDVFDTYKIEAGIGQMRQAYGAKGFIDFSVVPAFNFDDTNSSITLILEIGEGRQFHFGSIEVPGVDPELARNLLVQSGIASGKVFDPSRFAELWKQSDEVLPENLELENIERHINADHATVDLTLRVHACPVR